MAFVSGFVVGTPVAAPKSACSRRNVMVMSAAENKQNGVVKAVGAGLAGLSVALVPAMAMAMDLAGADTLDLAALSQLTVVFGGISGVLLFGNISGNYGPIAGGATDNYNLEVSTFKRFNKRKTVGQFMADFVEAKYKAMSMPGGLYDPQCREGAAKNEAFMKRHQAMSRQVRHYQRSTFEVEHDKFANRKLATVNLGHICNAEEEDFYRFPELAATYCMTKMEYEKTCDRYSNPSTPAEKYMMASIKKQMEARATPYGVYGNGCSEGRFKGDAEARRVAAGTVAFVTRNMSPAAKAAQKFNSRRYAMVNGHPCEYEEQMFQKFPAVAASMRSDVYRY